MKKIKRDSRSNAWARHPGWIEANIHFFQNMVRLHIKLKEMTHAATW